MAAGNGACRLPALDDSLSALAKAIKNRNLDDQFWRKQIKVFKYSRNDDQMAREDISYDSYKVN